MVNREAIEARFLSDLSNSSEGVRKDRLFYCRMFLDYAGDTPLSEWRKELWERFRRKLSTKRKDYNPYSPGTVAKIYGIVKRTYDAAKAVHESEKQKLIAATDTSNPAAVAEMVKALSTSGPDWDVGKRGAPRVKTGDVRSPAMTFDEIALMVKVARNLGGVEAAVFSMLSVYGMREGEVSLVAPEHFDFPNRTIFVMTEKGGEQREQYLAEELIPYLEDFQGGVTRGRVYNIFRRLEYKAGIEHQEGSGPHALRRYLDTALVDLFDVFYAHVFLRWKAERQAESSAMVGRYYKKRLEVDRKVLAKHPVLPLWR